MGREEEQDQHELRQVEQSFEVSRDNSKLVHLLIRILRQVLLRQVHHDQGARQALRLQVRLPRADGRLSLASPRLRL